MLEMLEDRRLMDGALAATGDFAETVRNVPITIPILANDFIPDPSTLTISLVTQGTTSTPILNGDNTVTYVPAPDATGLDQFSYILSDTSGTATGSVCVNIAAPPSASYADYQLAVSAADQIYFNAVQSAANNAQQSINSSFATLSAAAQQLYADYQSGVTTAGQTYQAAHDGAAANFQQTLLQTKMMQNDADRAALDAYNAATTGPTGTLDRALQDAQDAYHQATQSADEAYQSALSPYQAALDQAGADLQANPDDSALQAALQQAQAAYDAANAQATADHGAAYTDAQAILYSDQAAAQADFDAAIAPPAAVRAQAIQDGADPAAAQEAYNLAVYGPSGLMDQAAQSAQDVFDQVMLAADTAYQAALATYQAALDQASADLQANPDDPDLQAAMQQAQSAYDAANAQATTIYDAASSAAQTARQSALDAATTRYGSLISSANATLDAALESDAVAYDAAEQSAWNLAQMSEYAAQADFTAAEQSAWETYQLGLASLNAQQQAVETSALTLFGSQRGMALAAWQTAEATAWQTFAITLPLTTEPLLAFLGNRQLEPGVGVVPPIGGNVLLEQQKLQPVLAAPAEGEFFVVQPVPRGSRPFWQNYAREVRDNYARTTHAAYARETIARLDTDYQLHGIPRVTPNEAGPVFVEMSGDRAGARPVMMNGGGVSYYSLATPAQRARINLRANLVNLKQELVNRIYNMVINNPPAGLQWNDNDRNQIADMTNQTADDLIRMVDLFLRSHPGAAPEQGTRWRWQSRFDHPWCADWTGAMMAWISGCIITRGLQYPGNGYLRFLWGQSNSSFLGGRITLQHNFVILVPSSYLRNHDITSFAGDDAVDPVIKLFDPWRELLPRAYVPIPWGEQPRRTPTYWYESPQDNDDFNYYFGRLNDHRFSDRMLRLGEFFPPPPPP